MIEKETLRHVEKETRQYRKRKLEALSNIEEENQLQAEIEAGM